MQIQLFTPYLLVWEMFRNSVMDLCLIPCLERTYVLQTIATFQWPKFLSPVSPGSLSRTMILVLKGNMQIAWIL